MKKIIKYGFGCLLAATLPMMISCNEDDISSDITEIIYPSYVNVDIPDELQGYIYTDATQADVLPMLKGEKATLGYTMPDDANYRDVVWESSNPDVATVDENGLVTAVGGDGTSYSIITVHPKVYFSGSNGLAGTLKILVSDVLNPVTDVRISFDERDEYYESDILLLKYALSPVDATYRTVKWTSSDSETATVDSNGKVILLKAGTVTITATSMDGKASDSVTFNILTGEAPTSVTFDDENAYKNLAYGQKLDLKSLVKMEPADATFSKISWSDGAGLCSIDGNGIMTVKYTGMPTILAMSGHNTELVASDRNTGAELGRITITVDGGYFRYNFGDGVNDAFVLKEGTTYTKQDRSIYFDLNQSGRQDISIASTNNQGGFYISTAKYRYFAMKMRRPYNYDEGTGAYGSCAPGTPEGWRYNKLALNFNIQKADGTNDNWGHQTFSQELDMSSGMPTLQNITWDGQFRIYVYDFGDKSRLTDQVDAATGLVNLRHFDIIVADLNNVNEKSYEIYWMGTFDSLEAIKEYSEANE